MTLKESSEMGLDLELFKKDPRFRDFQDKDWALLEKAVESASFKAKTVIFKENEPGDGFYWVHQGKVRISRQFTPEGKTKSQENVLAVLEEGHLFGEMALGGAARSADAITETKAVLYYFSQDHYKKLCQEHPETAMLIQDILVRTLCARLREANRSFETIAFWCS
jgi:CRP-like cAMP-binding protein